jgi:hypothetical protein
MTATAYERIIDRLRDQGKKIRQGSTETRAQCPATGCPAKSVSLAVYPKPGRTKVICYAGCDDALDILPALNLTVADLFDDPHTVRTTTLPDPWTQIRIEARRTMTAPQRQLDNLIHREDIGTRLCVSIAKHRPELYLVEKHAADEPLDTSTNAVIVDDPCYRHVAHLLGGAR